ncbi:MAG: TonB-dependent receptor [Hyphomonadaceae bacterium]
MKTVTQLRTALLMSGALLGMASAPAFAQSAPDISADQGPSAEDTVAAPDGDQGRDVVIVSALKRDTDLQDTPIAIAVIDPELIKDNHVQSLFNLSDGIIPSLRIATFEARQSALTIGMRGIVPFDQNQTARDSGVGTYIDGVYMGRSQGLNAALFDVERIEVLRGPQGTLFGRNTEGGALSIVTKAPTGVFEGRAVAYGSYNAEIHQNFEEFAGLSLKFDGVIQHQDPTTKNPMAGQAGWNQYHRVGGRIQGLWKPVDTFSADLSIDYAKDENTPFYSQLLNYNVNGKTVRPIGTFAGPATPGSAAASGAPAGFINALSPLIHVGTDRQSVGLGTVQQPSVDKTGGAALTMKWDVTPDLQLRSITAAHAVATNQWDNSGIESRNVFAPGALFGRYSLSDLYQYQYSQEFQAVGTLGDNIDYVAGLYYFTEHAKESAATPFTNVWNSDGTGYTIRSSNGTFGTGAITSANQGWEYGTRLITRRTRADSDSLAAYGQVTWSPIEPLHLTAGGRYTKDTREGLMDRANNQNVNFALDYDDSRFDPLVIAAYDLSSDMNVYAKYSTGFRAGGANARSAAFTEFKPEEVKAYEAGLKSSFFDRQLIVNLAAYHMDRTDTQIDFDSVSVVAPNAGTHFEETANAPGKSKIDGIEADATWYVTDELSFGASYAYTKVDIPAAPFPFATGPSDFIQQGQPFPVNVVYTPENAASAFMNYEVPVGAMTFRAHLDASYADAQYSFQTEFADISSAGATAANNRVVAVKGDSSFIVNGSIALADINMSSNGGPTATISLWARNLLDETYVYRISAANRGTIGDYGNLNPPRTIGVEATVKY